MQKQQIGFLRKLLGQDLIKELKPDVKVSPLIQGLLLLIEVNPLIGIEFFDVPLVIPSK